MERNYDLMLHTSNAPLLMCVFFGCCHVWKEFAGEPATLFLHGKNCVHIKASFGKSFCLDSVLLVFTCLLVFGKKSKAPSQHGHDFPHVLVLPAWTGFACSGEKLCKFYIETTIFSQ
jgi:hypothetical protein